MASLRTRTPKASTCTYLTSTRRIKVLKILCILTTRPSYIPINPLASLLLSLPRYVRGHTKASMLISRPCYVQEDPPQHNVPKIFLRTLVRSFYVPKELATFLGMSIYRNPMVFLRTRSLTAYHEVFLWIYSYRFPTQPTKYLQRTLRLFYISGSLNVIRCHSTCPRPFDVPEVIPLPWGNSMYMYLDVILHNLILYTYSEVILSTPRSFT